MQTPTEQRAANQARITAYHRRCCAWLKAAPAQCSDRIKELDRRYCAGLALKRAWRSAWHSPSSTIIAFPGNTP